jgi:hypothetical protein
VNGATRTKLIVRKLGKVLKGNPDDAPPTISFSNGVVSAVVAGASVDNLAQVTVTVDGSDTLAPYLLSYANPTVGDFVRVEFKNGSPLITGEIVGLPSF